MNPNGAPIFLPAELRSKAMIRRRARANGCAPRHRDLVRGAARGWDRARGASSSPCGVLPLRASGIVVCPGAVQSRHGRAPGTHTSTHERF
jgi:hypothetical protein